MKTSSFLEYILGDVFQESLHVTSRSMMGGYVLYSEGKVFAIVGDDQLWFKGSNELAEWYLSRGSKKFSYTKPARAGGEGKEQGMNYFLVPEEIIESRSELQEWLDIALSVASIPKKKG